ncbi:MAG: 50S ribosomal protein L3 [Candidatus Marinimicrobia bacterium]|nr:50S ribosomal protein L3 [Candidatus Neomarinimicrobiota bacterium]
MAGILGKKLGMTRYFTEEGRSFPVTLVEVTSCVVTQIKTIDSDGYDAVQVGYFHKKESKINKPILGIFKKANVEAKLGLTEFKGQMTLMDGEEEKPVEVGSKLTIDQFQAGEKVRIRSKSKGKGFAGVVKRHHFKGGPASHGQGDKLRSRGSVGASSYPSRVIKGMKMAGRMGGENTTLRDVQILEIDSEKNLLVLKGPIPGAINSTVRIWK